MTEQKEVLSACLFVYYLLPPCGKQDAITIKYHDQSDFFLTITMSNNSTYIDRVIKRFISTND